ncbi:MAG TPA: hypothetical protein VGI10_14690 [Polyangiaceae bacterium]
MSVAAILGCGARTALLGSNEGRDTGASGTGGAGGLHTDAGSAGMPQVCPTLDGGLCHASCSLTCGAAEQAPVVVGCPTFSPFNVALGPDTIYVSSVDEPDVYSVPLCGGPLTRLAVTHALGSVLATAGNDLYFTDSVPSNGTILRSSPGAPPVPIYGLAAGIYALAVDASGIYAVTQGPDVGGLWQVAQDGSGARELLSQSDLAQAIALDSDSVYVANLAPAALLRVPKSGGAPIKLADDIVYGTLAADGKFLYWTTWGGPGRVMSVAKDGSALTTIAAAEDGPTIGLALDGGRVYWSDQDSGTIRAAAKNGGAPMTIASGQLTVEHLAQAGGWLAWVNYGDASIVRMRTPP